MKNTIIILLFAGCLLSASARQNEGFPVAGAPDTISLGYGIGVDRDRSACHHDISLIIMKREYRNRIRIIVCHKDVLFIREKVYIRGIAAADREHIQLREQAGLRISPEDTKEFNYKMQKVLAEYKQKALRTLENAKNVFIK